MTVLEILLPLVAVVLLTLPLIKVFTGKVSAQSQVYLQQVKLLQSLVQLLKV